MEKGSKGHVIISSLQVDLKALFRFSHFSANQQTLLECHFCERSSLEEDASLNIRRIMLETLQCLNHL